MKDTCVFFKASICNTQGVYFFPVALNFIVQFKMMFIKGIASNRFVEDHYSVDRQGAGV